MHEQMYPMLLPTAGLYQLSEPHFLNLRFLPAILCTEYGKPHRVTPDLSMGWNLEDSCLPKFLLPFQGCSQPFQPYSQLWKSVFCGNNWTQKPEWISLVSFAVTR